MRCLISKNWRSSTSFVMGDGCCPCLTFGLKLAIAKVFLLVLFPLAVCLPLWLTVGPSVGGESALLFFMLIPHALYPIIWMVLIARDKFDAEVCVASHCRPCVVSDSRKNMKCGFFSFLFSFLFSLSFPLGYIPFKSDAMHHHPNLTCRTNSYSRPPFTRSLLGLFYRVFASWCILRTDIACNHITDLTDGLAFARACGNDGSWLYHYIACSECLAYSCIFCILLYIVGVRGRGCCRTTSYVVESGCEQTPTREFQPLGLH